MMYKMPSQVAAQEYSFEMNAHNRTLLSQIQRASRSADAMRYIREPSLKHWYSL